MRATEMCATKRFDKTPHSLAKRNVVLLLLYRKNRRFFRVQQG